MISFMGMIVITCQTCLRKNEMHFIHGVVGKNLQGQDRNASFPQECLKTSLQQTSKAAQPRTQPLSELPAEQLR